MNIQQLEYIVALDTYKNFSKAAESCFITQATLSTMIKRLEDEIDVVLFDRKKTPIITTDCGKEIIEEAKLVLFHKNKLKEISLDIKGKIEGSLRIGIIPTIAANLLHRILASVMRKYPKLKLTILEITTQNIIDKIKKGELDMGIVSTPLLDDEMEEKILYYEKLMVYGNSESLKTKYLNPNDLANHKIWLLEKENCLADQITNICSLQKKEALNNLDFQPNSFDSLLNIVDNFDGLTLIPELYFLDMPLERKKNVRDFVSPFPVREVSIIYHRPYAKFRLIEAISKEIKTIIEPLLESSQLKNSEMMIAKI